MEVRTVLIRKSYTEMQVMQSNKNITIELFILSVPWSVSIGTLVGYTDGQIYGQILIVIIVVIILVYTKKNHLKKISYQKIMNILLSMNQDFIHGYSSCPFINFNYYFFFIFFINYPTFFLMNSM